MTRSQLFGLPVDLLDMDQTVAAVTELVGRPGTHQHVVLNASKVVQAQKDAQLRAAIEACDLVNADGMSIVWAGRLLGVPVPERVAGIDLMDRLLAAAADRGWRVYLLGARQDVVERVAAIEQRAHPGLQVCGFRNGYWTDAEENDIVQAIAVADPQLLFVAMPSPRKEHFLARHRETLAVPFVMGVGGSFDVVAGVTSRAPVSWQKLGLEWLYRFLQEPRRMWKRYLVGNVQFLWLVARAAPRALAGRKVGRR